MWYDTIYIEKLPRGIIELVPKVYMIPPIIDKIILVLELIIIEFYKKQNKISIIYVKEIQK